MIELLISHGGDINLSGDQSPLFKSVDWDSPCSFEVFDKLMNLPGLEVVPPGLFIRTFSTPTDRLQKMRLLLDRGASYDDGPVTWYRSIRNELWDNNLVVETYELLFEYGAAIEDASRWIEFIIDKVHCSYDFTSLLKMFSRKYPGRKFSIKRTPYSHQVIESAHQEIWSRFMAEHVEDLD